MTDDQLDDLLSLSRAPEPSPELERSVRDAWSRLAKVHDSGEPRWRRSIRIPAWTLTALPVILVAIWLLQTPVQDTDGFALSDFKPAPPVVEIILVGGNHGPPLAR